MKKIRRNKKEKLHFKNNMSNSKIDVKNIENTNSNFRYNNDKTDLEKNESDENTGSRVKYRKEIEVNKARKSNLELVILMVYSLGIYLIIETISRKSFNRVIGFFADFPIQSVVNYLLIVLIFSITLIVKRKKLIYFLLSFILILLSVISSMLSSLRGMPLSPYDIYSYREALELQNSFLDIKTTIALIVVVVLSIAFMIFFFVKDNNRKRITGIRNIIISLILLTTYLIVIPQLRTAKILDPIAWDVNLSYANNGFVYSIVDATRLAMRGKPEGYSEEAIKKIRNEVDIKKASDKRTIFKGDKKPNIIFVQLEAFFDPTRIKECHFTEDPIPNMRRLMKNYTSGYMNVPVTGGGTARTEYEVVSGSNFEFLNQGEIPYYTFLSEKPSISLATDLRMSGYKTTLIHNYYQKFYNRDKGYENMGFQKYIPLQSMKDVEFTPMGWPKDKILSRYISNVLYDNKDKRNLIMTISTQGHSKYPTGDMDLDYRIELKNTNLPKPDINQINYYINQLKDMDDFVGNLVKETNKSKVPTVLVFYGDHLPALNILTRGQTGLDLYSSLFAVVNNYGEKKVEIPKDFQSYQLSTLVLDIAKQPYGPMNLVHAYLHNDKDYRKKMELVQYDILFGKKYFLKSYEMPKKNHIEI